MGIYQSTVNGVCAGSTAFNNAAFAGFSVEVQCTSTTLTEGASPARTIVTWRLVAIASSGIYGSLDYVQRRLRATVSLDLPWRSGWPSTDLRRIVFQGFHWPCEFKILYTFQLVLVRN